jgi:hypothetical protein
MTSRKFFYILGALAFTIALWGFFVTFDSGAIAGNNKDKKTNKSDKDSHGLMYQNLGF